MNLPKVIRRYGMSVRGVIHVGAHLAQEKPVYDELGIRSQVWIEPHPAIYPRMAERVGAGEGVWTINVACGAEPGTATLHILEGADHQSNSLLPPAEHLRVWPQLTPGGTVEVPVARLDDALRERGVPLERFNLLSLDVQGFELQVLRGAPETLKSIDYMIAEVSTVEMYKGCCLLADLEPFLRDRGFHRVYTKWVVEGHGDALFIHGRRLSGLRRLQLATLGPKERGPARPSPAAASAPTS